MIDVSIVWVNPGRDVTYRTLAPVHFATSLGSITVPAGFVTDFASIPQAAQSFVGKERPAVVVSSLLHDYIYQMRGEVGLGSPLNREQADRLMLEIMEKVGGTSAVHRGVIYRAVRAFGGRAWKS